METLEAILNVDVEARDAAWEKTFLKTFALEKVQILAPEPREGPDHWPYLMVSTGNEADESLINVLSWLATRGIGLVVNPQKPMPDYVMTYGMVWNFRERGEFLTEAPTAPSSGRVEFKQGQKLWAGPPSEAYFPKYARSVLKQFFADQGIFTAKILMISQDHDQEKGHFDLCFSIESLKSPPAHEHANLAEAISWFVPAHYTVALVSEKVVAGFIAL
jgi:hypothetical protein